MKINLFLTILALGSIGPLCAMDDNGAGPAFQVAVANRVPDRRLNTLFSDPFYTFQSERDINDTGVQPDNIHMLLLWCTNTFNAQEARPADRLLNQADVTDSRYLKQLKLNFTNELNTLEVIRKQVDAIFLAIQAPHTQHNTQAIRAQLKIVYLRLLARYQGLINGPRIDCVPKIKSQLEKAKTIGKIAAKLAEL